MKVFVIITDDLNGPRMCYTGLKGACRASGVSYNTAVRNWKGFYIGKKATIAEYEVERQPGKKGNGGFRY